MGRKLSYIISIFCAALAISSCDLTEKLQVDADRAMIFGTASGLETYSYSFYNSLPGTTNAYYEENGLTDYVSCKMTNAFIINGAFTAETKTSWSWTDLRNINYYLDGLKSKDCTVADDVRANYEGIARWFRAYFYYDKLKTYGAVPWYDEILQNYHYEEMYKDRDSRDVVIENIIADLDFAYENIAATTTVDNSLLTKYAAAALKSRVCLFEASFRKYHGLETDKYSAADLYAQTVDAANKVINSKLFSLNTDEGTVGAYREVFNRETPITAEVILSVCCSSASGITGSQNWHFNSASYGNGNCLARSFVHTFLKKDGKAFTDQANYQLTSFKDEFADRDPRLAQIVRGPSYKMDGSAVVADIVNGVAMTGYHIIKFSLDSESYNNGSFNTNSTPLIRYAEVLLNYAEAKAELGELTDSDWSKSVGAIRKRAGITGGVSTCPTTVDSYMQSTFYPDVTDAKIMEIRRERAIELFFEGFRFDDIRRWKAGSLMETLPWTGIHIDALDTPIDVNGDGKNDFYFTLTPREQADAKYESIWVTVNAEDDGLWVEENAAGGYDLYHKTAPGNRRWYEDGRQYLYPIPAKVIRDYAAEGYVMTQNKNW